MADTCQPCRQGRCEDCQRLGLGCACCKPLTRREPPMPDQRPIDVTTLRILGSVD